LSGEEVLCQCCEEDSEWKPAHGKFRELASHKTDSKGELWIPSAHHKAEEMLWRLDDCNITVLKGESRGEGVFFAHEDCVQ